MREVTIHLSGEELAAFGIEEFVSVIQSAGLEQVNELQCQRPGCLLAIEVRDPIPAAQFSTLENLEWWEQIDRDDGVTYLCKLAVPAFDEGFVPHHETSVSQSAVESAGDGVDVTMVGSQEALSERVREYGDTGADPLLRTLTDYDGPENPLDAVTPRQQEVLETAFGMGYFDVPREATTDDIARALDLDPSTVREHLQRAQRNVLTEILDGA
ncbi:helix-turn-helix domain-containing protein [Halomarina salina]|uniref:Helix-turn-helix domain-containing protein n=1 Tax=Halomarina salina TaxID=1872699 RepID=A0ABD5RTE3_9EURY|nr:helix-turn-helix domain-containing protein [Halomarina salina]